MLDVKLRHAFVNIYYKKNRNSHALLNYLLPRHILSILHAVEKKIWTMFETKKRSFFFALKNTLH